MAYKCYYRVTSSSATDFMSKLYTYIEAMGWVKEKGLEIADAVAFQTAHAYVLGDMVKPTTLNGFVYICSTAGTSGATEPTWDVGTGLKGETATSTARFRTYLYGRVYSSQGEAGTEPKNYVYLHQSSTTAYCRLVGVIGTAQWVANTFLCGGQPNTLGNGISASPCYSFIYGNKDFVLVQTANAGAYSYGGFGFFTPVWIQRTVLTEAATAGSNINLVVASSANVTVGQWLQMWGATEEGRDKVVVSAVPDETHITVSTLPRNYSSGSWIGVMPVRALGMTITTGALSGGVGYMPLRAVGNEDASYSYYYSPGGFSIVNQLQEGIGPDFRLQKYLLRPALYTMDNYPYSPRENNMAGYLPTALILQQYKACTSLDLFLVYNGYVYPVTGTATSGGATTLTDTGKSLTTNAWAGKILVITGGIGVGQTREIISNTATEFTVNAWETNPDNSSTYVVVQEAWRALGDGSANCPVCKEIL